MTTRTIIPTSAPSLSNLTATGVIGGIKLLWDSINDTTYFATEIWSSSTNDRTTATLAATVLDNNYFYQLATNSTKYFWIRAKNIYNRSDGAWHPTGSTSGVSATSQLVQSADLASAVTTAITSAVTTVVLGAVAALYVTPRYQNTTQTGNTAATETDCFSHSIPGATLATNGQSLQVEAAGTFSGAVGANSRIKIIFGTTTIFDTGVLSISAAASWTLYFSIIRTGATSQKIAVSMNTSNAALMGYANYTTATETLSSSKTLKLTINGTNASDTVGEFYKELLVPNA